MDVPRKPERRRPTGMLLGAAALIAISIGFAQLRRAPPSIDREAIWIDEVKSGEMMRSVKGPGLLVPEHIRWITADTAGRVERIHLRPGALVEPDSILLELSNPDVQLEALEADRQLASAEAELLNLRSNLESAILAQRASLGTLETDLGEVARRAQANETLYDQKIISGLEAQQTSARKVELSQRVDLEKRRLSVLDRGMKDRLAAQKEQIAKLRAVALFRKRQVDSMQVRAADRGVLQELPLELGQWVTPGTLLAKVVQPERLKAELRIPETQAKDVALGQRAKIDTRNGIISGSVSRIPPAANQGTVRVEIALEGELPKGARPDLSIDGIIELEKLEKVLHVGRPTGAQPESSMDLFVLKDDGDAERVRVALGRASVSSIEVRRGLSAGDRVVLSDMTAWIDEERVTIR